MYKKMKYNREQKYISIKSQFTKKNCEQHIIDEIKIQYMDKRADQTEENTELVWQEDVKKISEFTERLEGREYTG